MTCVGRPLSRLLLKIRVRPNKGRAKTVTYYAVPAPREMLKGWYRT